MQSHASPIFDFHRYFGTAIPKAKFGKSFFLFFRRKVKRKELVLVPHLDDNKA